MADVTLNPIALVKTVVVIAAGMAAGYLLSHVDEQQGLANRAAIMERLEIRQQQAESERLQPDQDARQVLRDTHDKIQTASERMQAEQQAESERRAQMTPEERFREQQVDVWGEERVRRQEEARAREQAERDARETRTWAEILGEPATPERAGESERRTITWDNLRSDRQQPDG